jgi:type I restriction enzyme S subunit
MREWVEKPLGDFCDIKHGFAFKGEYFTSQPTEYYLVTPANFAIGGGFQNGKDTYYTSDFPDEYALQQGDLIVTMTDLSKTGDTLGFSALVPYSKDYKYLHNQRIGKVIVDEKKAIKLFIYWLMRTYAYQRYVVGLATGSTVKHTAPKSIQSFKYKFPDLPTQTRIAEILTAYDDAIENNNRRIALLEKAARELYREWFVRMRFPGYENTRFVNGLPEGWEVVPFGSLADIIDGDRGVNYPKQDEFFDEGYCLFLNAGNVTKNGFDFGNNAFITENKDSLLRKGKLARNDIVLTTRGTVGNVAYYSKHIPYDVMRINSGMVILRDSSEVPPEFLYITLRSDAVQKMIELFSSGSAQPQLPIKDMRKMKIIKPTGGLLSRFAEIVGDILNQAALLQTQSQNLARQRDLLLPRLMSGKLEV